MSDSKTRRTVALINGSKDDLEKIKDKTGASTDTAAINDAVSFRAQFLDRNIDTIQDALSFSDKILSKYNREEVLVAMSIYDQLKTETQSGSDLFLENPKTPNMKVKLFVPSLG